MILIADSGSTKATWCYIRQNGERVFFDTEGYNPCHVNSEYIARSLQHAVPAGIDKQEVKEIYFYGAGCYEENAPVIQNALYSLFGGSHAFVGSDLLAAARALLKDRPGFAAILGTGTNTGIYNGNEIIFTIDSLGYILGDEGSGCAIGKKLLTAYTRGYLPPEVKTVFWERYHLTVFDIINAIYSQPLPNRFCSSFSQFVFDHLDINYLRGLVKECFQDFFKNLVSLYPDFSWYSFNCVGSVGYSFKNILSEVAEEFQMKPGMILKNPIEELAEYHAMHL